MFITIFVGCFWKEIILFHLQVTPVTKDQMIEYVSEHKKILAQER